MAEVVGIRWDKVAEYWNRGEREKVLAAFGIPPFSTKYSKEEIEYLRREFGITSVVTCVPCLLNAFKLDVLLPPPFRPPLMLLMCFIGRACP